MIRLQYRDEPHRYVNLSARSITLGRDPNNVVAIDDPAVSDFHAEITRDAAGLVIIDLLSATGTYVNGRRIANRHPLCTWDVVRVGTAEFEINDPSQLRPNDWALQAESDLLGAKFYALRGRMVLGRDPDCDVTIDDHLLSRRHAALTVQGDELEVVDLGSANGTFLNGRRVTRAVARPGDRLQFESSSFVVVGPKRSLPRAPGDPTVLKAPGGAEPPAITEALDAEPVTELIAERRPPARLIEQSDLLGRGRRLDLNAPRYSIGRSDGNDIVLRDSSVSRTHARLVLANDQWVIEDNGSSNGVQVNGNRVTRAELGSGDTITLGRAVFLFETEA